MKILSPSEPDASGKSASDFENLLQLLAKERAHAQQLSEALCGLQNRLQAIEASRWWKIREHCRRLRARLKRRMIAHEHSGWFGRFAMLLSRSGRKLLRRGLANIFRTLYLFFDENGAPQTASSDWSQFAQSKARSLDPYSAWLAQNTPMDFDLLDYRDRARGFAYQPTISILLAVHKPELEPLLLTLESVLSQAYPNWELCIAVNPGGNRRVRTFIADLALRDSRVKALWRKDTGNAAAVANSALSLATGAFATFLDDGDRMRRDALFRVAQALNEDTTLDLLYADEDKVDETGCHFDPLFKPKWCPDSLLARNYIGHALVARMEFVRWCGGFCERLSGGHEHDLVLRLTESTRRIHHIPQVLYHARADKQAESRRATSNAAVECAGVVAVTEALERRGEAGRVEQLLGRPGRYTVRYNLVRPGKVSILIPTRDHASVLEVCLHSLFKLTEHRDFEVILIDNNSEEQKTRDLLQRYRRLFPEQFRVLSLSVPFNFSRLMNAAAAEARGDYLLLLNNDTEITHADWLGAMVEYAQRPTIGCVGAKLLYPDRTVQHAGVVLGRGRDSPWHAFAHADADKPGHGSSLYCVTNYSAVTAACMMVRRELYHRLNGFDEALAVEFNDVDFCLRAKNAGYNNVYLPHVVLCHHESLTRGHPLANSESARRFEAEKLILCKRWPMYVEDDPCVSPHLTLGPDGDFQLRPDSTANAPKNRLTLRSAA